MNEILINAMTILVLLAGLATLVVWARRDALTARAFNDPAAETPVPDSVVAGRVRAQRTLKRLDGDVRPATYESHATTATA
jgi:hypothetical protein